MTRQRIVSVALGAGAIALGIAAFDAARLAPGFSPAGSALSRLTLGIAAGWAVIAAGRVYAAGGRRPVGRLLVGAGFAWLASGLGTPGSRFAPLFTLGLLFGATAPALVCQVLLLGSGSGRRGRSDRVVLVLAYLAFVGLLGLLPTVAEDPAASGCASCPDNLLRVTTAPGLVDDVSHAGIRLGVVALSLVAISATWRALRATPAQRRDVSALLLPCFAYLALVGVELGHSWQRGYLGLDQLDQKLWAGQAAALLAVAAGVGLVTAAAHRRRARLAQLVVEVAKAPRAGGLRAALANLLGDPDLELLHAARSSGVWIDATGAIRQPPPKLATTALVRDGHEVALLCHRPGLLDDRRVVGEIEESVRLGLDNERLQGELRGQLARLNRSRAAVLTTGEAERRLLERNLHDGAQQRLAAFSFALGVAQHNAASDAAPALARAQGEVQAALTELRELAHGLYPIALSEGGLATAVESLRDRRPGLRVIELPAERLPPSIEETAYVAIASLADAWSPAPVTVRAVRNDEHIVITLETPAGMPTETLELDDRADALGGTLAFETTATRQTRVTVDLPCE